MISEMAIPCKRAERAAKNHLKQTGHKVWLCQSRAGCRVCDWKFDYEEQARKAKDEAGGNPSIYKA